MTYSTHPLAAAIESLLRSIPERWQDFDFEHLTAAEQQAQLLLVAAGLIERKFRVRLRMAGREEYIDATIVASGECGLTEAIEPMIAEGRSMWDAAIAEWQSSSSAGGTPFRITRLGNEQWRLTEFGVMGRMDLDVEAPSEGSAAFVGCRQRVLEFVLCIGHQKDRPQVGGAGRLIDMEVERSQSATRQDDRDADAEPALVSISNLEELATTLNDNFLPDLVEAIGQPAAGEAAQEPRHEPEDQVSYALTQNEALVLKTLGLFDSSILVSAATIEREMDPRERISNRTINTAVRRLIEIGLAERPEGPRRGCRLTRAGRVQMRKIAD